MSDRLNLVDVLNTWLKEKWPGLITIGDKATILIRTDDKHEDHIICLNMEATTSCGFGAMVPPSDPKFFDELSKRISLQIEHNKRLIRRIP